ncbi:MAG: hypothetical protein KA796_11975 [Chryseobacterium sp.]|nr:hypothetical protein [Chryseobacterium sp.]MBP7500564.1 hypothetical protein [Chryseobacterium sp.]
MRKLDKHLIGLTGEYLVAGMMSLKGWVASLTLKNYPSVDIFGMNPEIEKTINIQVKTTKNHKSYQIGLMRSQRNNILGKITCPFVFVHIDKTDDVRYFILSQNELVSLIIETDDEYFNRPRQITLKDYPIAINLKDLLEFENEWDSLWK